MKHSVISRRQCLAGLLSASVPKALRARPPEQTLAVSNPALEFQVVRSEGRIISRTLTNKLANEAISLPAEDFALEFEQGGVARSSAFSVDAQVRRPTEIDLSYSAASGPWADVQVRVLYQLPPRKAYLRKQISLRQANGSSRRLMRADLENWLGVRRPWESMHADALPYGSHPIYCDTLWAGVEFVAAFNQYSTDGFVLRSRPGARHIDSDWYPLHSTVVGGAQSMRAREAFLRYIEDIRLSPPKLVACYNTWWTYYAKELDQDKYQALVEELRTNLYDTHRVFFDVVATDEGWADRDSIWEIDNGKLPYGFDRIRTVVESAGGNMGLWISPSAVYPNSLDYEWAKNNGYRVLEYEYAKSQRRPGLSLADPNYRNAVKRQLQRLIKDNGLQHVKYDGFIAVESQAHDDLLAGKDSVEPLAYHFLELLQASKAANPNLTAEPTCLNSHRNYISPWIIQHADVIWGNSGGDCPKGIGPAPDYRESHTTAREYYIFSSMNEVWLPQNALQYFDIVQADDAGFANHAAMAFGRGRFFVPTYVNPRFMDEEDWRIYGGLLRWARNNREILRNTYVIPRRVELGEPYVYAHWLGMRGILVVRNPSNETKPFVLDLHEQRTPRQLSDAVCYAQYPYRKGIAAGLNGLSKISLNLAPWELLFLEIRPRRALSEPVAMDARWYRNPDGSMQIAPNAQIHEVRLLLPEGAGRAAAVTPRIQGTLSGGPVAHTVRRLPEADWLKQNGKPLPTVAFESEYRVSVPAAAKGGKVLLLLEFPGREHRPNTCDCLVNGKGVKLAKSSSAGRTGRHAGRPNSPWKDVLPYESEWTWHICDITTGESSVKFTGTAANPECRIGAWVWADWDLAANSVPVSVQCPEPQMPSYHPHLDRRGNCLRPPR